MTFSNLFYETDLDSCCLFSCVFMLQYSSDSGDSFHHFNSPNECIYSGLMDFIIQ